MNAIQKGIFRRVELLMGADFMRRAANTSVIIFGVGGVGSWCAESLVRSGVGHLTLVDSDRVCHSNINRQLMATCSTVGQVKVEALKTHLLDINPEADITALQQVYEPATAHSFGIEDYDYIVDAIDSLANKVQLILHATRVCKAQPNTKFFSSMGAALRTDPFAVTHGEFYEVEGDTLARALRKRFKNLGQYPARKFQCVYSRELPRPNLGCETSEEDEPDMRQASDPVLHSTKAQTNGTMAHVTIMFGTALAGLILQDLSNKK